MGGVQGRYEHTHRWVFLGPFTYGEVAPLLVSHFINHSGPKELNNKKLAQEKEKYEADC